MHVIVDQPIKDELATYYETIYLEDADLYDYDRNETYYICDTNNNLIKVSNPIKDEFYKYLYFVESEKVKIKELINLENI